MIKAVIFDIDGVLIDSMEPNRQLFRNILKEGGYKKLPSKREFSKTFHLTARDTLKVLTQGDKKELDRLMNLLHELRDTIVLKIMPGSLKIIKLLHKKYKLALVTSRTQGGLEQYLLTANTANYFVAMIHLELSKNPKPHPEPLLLACKKLKIKPEQGVYIGDARTDIAAAKAAGMKVILYPKKRISGADGYAKDISDIPKIISQINNKK